MSTNVFARIDPDRFRAIWMTLLILDTMFAAWASVLNNRTDGSYWWLVSMAGMVPLWAIVSATTRALVFDGMLYDATMALVYGLVMAWLSQAALSALNWAGLALVVAGLVLLKF